MWIMESSGGHALECTSVIKVTRMLRVVALVKLEPFYSKLASWIDDTSREIQGAKLFVQQARLASAPTLVKPWMSDRVLGA